jgi:hypothetical protein
MRYHGSKQLKRDKRAVQVRQLQTAEVSGHEQVQFASAPKLGSSKYVSISQLV